MNLATPIGFRDILPNEASARERITRDVQDLFASHGFEPIETPTLEVMDVMTAGAKLPTSPFKFFDSQGDLLAMRPDVTMQVARMCAARYSNDETPRRFRYTQRVFREAQGDASMGARECTQIGVECVGETDRKTDSELICLLVQSLKLSGVKNICVALATVAPLRALLARSGAKDEWIDAVLRAFHKSDFVELDRLTSLGADCDVNPEGVAPAYAEAIRKLARIRGGVEAIDEARKITAPLGCDAGLAEFEATFNEIVAMTKDANAVSDAELAESAVTETEQDDTCDVSLLVDFSVMSSFGYYTGIVFEAYSPYLGTTLGSGGRYDTTIGAYGKPKAAAGFAFELEQVMQATEMEDAAVGKRTNKLRIAVPKGALNKDAIICLEKAGLNVDGLDNPGRQLIICTESADYIIVRPSDAPAFVAAGAADCGICGRDSLEESQAQVVELADLKFGGCRFVVAEPKGSARAIQKRYERLGSMRIATKYPHIAFDHFAKRGIQVEIVKLHGNIELAPLTGLADRIVDITATGTTLKENNLEVVEDVMSSTARFFANPCLLRTNDKVIELARLLESAVANMDFDPIAGASQ